MIRPFAMAIAALTLSASGAVFAEPIGEVSTTLKLLSPNDKVVVEAYPDEMTGGGVVCYVSRAVSGGFKGLVGLAEDKAEASIACRQVAPIKFSGPVPLQGEVFSQRLSVLFKKLRVVRMVDQKRNTLVYLTYSDKLVDGSPKNAVTAVPVDRSTPIPVK